MFTITVNENIDEETLEKKAYRTYLKGRVLNVAPDHCPEAEQLLSKAVKLEPNLVNAWIELGECYWKRGEVETAKTCFEGALSHVSNEVFDVSETKSICQGLKLIFRFRAAKIALKKS